MRRLLLLIAGSLTGGCVGPCVSHPWTLYALYPLAIFDPRTYRGHDGSSIPNAVVLDGLKGEKATDEAESAFIIQKFIIQKFKIDSHQPLQPQFQHFGAGQKKYHVVSFRTKDGIEEKVFFEITSTL
jgi:hypothetical protein